MGGTKASRRRHQRATATTGLSQSLARYNLRWVTFARGGDLKRRRLLRADPRHDRRSRSGDRGAALMRGTDAVAASVALRSSRWFPRVLPGAYAHQSSQPAVRTVSADRPMG